MQYFFSIKTQTTENQILTLKQIIMRNNILDNILKIRSERGFSQEFVASKLGLKQAGYALIERGERALSYERLLQIAIIFEMDVIDIITYPQKNNDLEKTNETKILVEIKLTNEDFENLGIREKVISTLTKKINQNNL